MRSSPHRFIAIALVFLGLLPHAWGEDPVSLTPPAPHEPQLHGPKVYGVRPGSPFLYRIPCTGDRPLAFRAEGLPEGLILNARSGIITGVIAQPGTTRVTLYAKNGLGESRREFRIVAGDTLALTPPMGWNDWYAYYERISEATMRQGADEMVASGMADYGYQYVNCDDCWAMKPGSKDPNVSGPARDAQGEILPNKRFPDIKGMVDYIHAKGLKAGIYTSPGPLTCGGYEGAWQHEAQDAGTFADWGFDFLKYDLCSYRTKMTSFTPDDYRKPYQQMSDALRKQKRDIVLNLCEYGEGDVWKWGAEVGQCWRTTGDLGLEKRGQLPGFYAIARANAAHADFAKPGGWNDPDYLIIGWAGNAWAMDEGRKTTLTPDEQYSYMSLWSLMAAPLFFSGEMAKLDAFTLGVLCNAEVIDVDQDPLGRQGKLVRQSGDELVFVKELEDGSKAVGLFNLTAASRKMSVSWSEIGVSGRQLVRDLWRQKEVGAADREFAAEVPSHGVALVTIRRN